MNKYLIILIHPALIYACIAFLSCIPHTNEDIIYDKLPSIGENFKVKNNSTVYYLDTQGKLQYTSIECFESINNIALGTPYQKGGVMIITERVNKQIPLIGSMCDSNTRTLSLPKEKYSTTYPISSYINTNYLLDHYSDFAHILCYFIFSLSLIFHFRKNEFKYYYSISSVLFGGLFLEVVQHYFILGRHLSFQDIILNLLGCLLGILVFKIVQYSIKVY